MFHLYNTLSRKKEPLHTNTPNHIKIYLCGPTVYDICHIGHARSWVIFDMMVRYWRDQGYEVTYVRNITDIDDKIIKRAAETNRDWKELTEEFTTAFQKNAEQLGTLTPDVQPKATDHIKEIIALIETLISEGSAYCLDDGNVCFDVQHFKEYGKLTHRCLEDMLAGTRVDVNADKKNPLDFVLWKPAKPGEPAWPSPWGDGRPGWHIECSAMSTHYLGQPFDIHGGGMDLKFPHHENEIAQSEAAHHKTFAHTWVHVGLVQINQEKMAKSLGNFFTIDQVLTQYPAETLRYFLLSSHYRSPVNYSDDNLKQAHHALTRLYNACRDLPLEDHNTLELPADFVKAMEDDFNTPEAFAVLFDLARDINQLKSNNNIKEAAQKAQLLKHLSNYFGFLQLDPDDFLKSTPNTSDKQNDTEIEALIEQRQSARQQKDWAESDKIRDQLLEKGIIIEDKADKTTWRRS